MHMNDLVELWDKPEVSETYMIAGWRQWADAGATSSELPKYLIDQTGARKIGEIKPEGCYLFQIPGTHHLLRPEVKLSDGYRQEMAARKNEFFYADCGEDKGLVVFLGEEPHLNEEGYSDAFFDAVEALKVKRVAAVGGVHGPMPYDRNREISCVYSLPEMHAELSGYAVKFSDYEGGSTIGTYLAHKAEPRGIEFLVFYAFVPAYDFSQLLMTAGQMRVERDFRAWHDLTSRLNHMFGLGLDLSDLEERSAHLTATLRAKIEALKETMPQLKVEEYMEEITSEFQERPFLPLDNVWEDVLRDLLEDTNE